MGTPAFTAAHSFAPNGTGDPLALVASGARAEPGPAEQRQAWALQVMMRADAAAQGPGAWAGDRYAQTNHYTGAIALAAKPYLNAIRAAKFRMLKRKPRRDGILSKAALTKSASGVGHYTRDEEYEPLDPDHPLCQVVERPNGPRGKWSLAREMAFLGLQYLLTGEAPAWAPCNDAGKPVQFYALVSALTQLQYGPGQSTAYPQGAYRVTPFTGSSFGLGGGLYSGALLPGEEVHRLIDEDPWVRGAGRSRLAVGAAHIDVFEAITRSRHSFFRSGPMLGGVIVLPGADASVTEVLSKQITANYGGADNHGKRILILGGGGMADKAAVQPLSMNAEEMGFLQSFEQALEFVLALFGVPKVVACVGEGVATYATWYAAKQEFRDGSLIPFFLRCSDFLTQALADPWAEEPGELRVEMEPPPLGDVEAEEKEREFAVAQGLITRNEYRAATGRTPDPDGDVPQTVYLAKLQQQVAPPPQPQPGEVSGQADQPPGAGASSGANVQETQGAADGDQDGAQGTQDAVVRAALAALGLDDDGQADGATETGSEPVEKALHKFASTHVELPAEIGDRLRALAAMIPDRDLGEDGREDEPHVTIRYGLETDDPAAVAPLVQGFGPVRLRLGKVSVFEGAESGKPYDVLKVDVDSLDLHVLNRVLADLPHTDTHPTYRPHATIAYVRAGLGEKYAEKMGAVDARTVAREIVFSDRDRHQTRIALEEPVVKAIDVTKPGGTAPRPVRREGEVWQSGGKWYTKKNGKVTETADPSKAKTGAQSQTPAGASKPGARGAPFVDPHIQRVIRHGPKNLKEGESYESGGYAFQMHGGKLVHVGNAGARQPQPAPGQTTAWPAGSDEAHDALAQKFLQGRPQLRLLTPDLKAHAITDGKSLRAFFAKGGKLPPGKWLDDAAQAVPATPAAAPALASAAQWAAQKAEQHADRVAAHFGITRERAHQLLTDAITRIAQHAAKSGGKVGALTIRDKRTGKTATLTPKPGATRGTPDPIGAQAPRPKAMSAYDDSAGGALVAPAQVGTDRRRKRVRACVARVLRDINAT
jgi:2'-5' RNA ligase